MESFHGNKKRCDALTLPMRSRDRISNWFAPIAVISRRGYLKRLWCPWRRKDDIWLK
jgi:hypothetical protein